MKLTERKLRSIIKEVLNEQATRCLKCDYRWEGEGWERECPQCGSNRIEKECPDCGELCYGSCEE